MNRHNDKNIKEVLAEFISSNKKVSGGYHSVKIEEIWKKEMGEMINSYTTGIKLNDGVLRIYLNSSALKKELSMGKEKIKNIINEALKSMIIKEVQIF